MSIWGQCLRSPWPSRPSYAPDLVSPDCSHVSLRVFKKQIFLSSKSEKRCGFMQWVRLAPAFMHSPPSFRTTSRPVVRVRVQSLYSRIYRSHDGTRLPLQLWNEKKQLSIHHLTTGPGQRMSWFHTSAHLQELAGPPQEMGRRRKPKPRANSEKRHLGSCLGDGWEKGGLYTKKWKTPKMAVFFLIFLVVSGDDLLRVLQIWKRGA